MLTLYAIANLLEEVRKACAFVQEASKRLLFCKTKCVRDLAAFVMSGCFVFGRFKVVLLKLF